MYTVLCREYSQLRLCTYIKLFVILLIIIIKTRANGPLLPCNGFFYSPRSMGTSATRSLKSVRPLCLFS